MARNSCTKWCRYPFHRALVCLRLTFMALFVIAGIVLGQQGSLFRADIPKTWDEKALASWATPLAGLNLRPSHISSEEYYALPVDNLKTYPVYLPDREPDGYWAMLNRVGAWIEAGKTVFEQMDHLHLRRIQHYRAC